MVTYSKDKHFLTSTDLCLEDKINFRLVEQMCTIKIQELLKNVPNRQGTINFSKIMNYVLSSFLEKL